MLENGQIRFFCKRKLFELPEGIINEFSKKEWEKYLEKEFNKMFEERKFFIQKADSGGFFNLLGEKNYIII